MCLESQGELSLTPAWGDSIQTNACLLHPLHPPSQHQILPWEVWQSPWDYETVWWGCRPGGFRLHFGQRAPVVRFAGVVAGSGVGHSAFGTLSLEPRGGDEAHLEAWA